MATADIGGSARQYATRGANMRDLRMTALSAAKRGAIATSGTTSAAWSSSAIVIA
jgi:hypothetical protein